MSAFTKLFLSLADGTRRDFYHRGTTADIGVINQIFRNEDYSLKRLSRGKEIFEIYNSLIRINRTPLVIDAGSNIGASALWFSLQFPKAKIICFEPEVSNFQLLKLNTAGCNVVSYNSAIGSEDGFVDIVDPGHGEWGYQTTLNNEGNVKLISLARVVSESVSLGYEPFIIKIDIEGGESELFSKKTEWIKEFPLLIIELHDWLLPKQGTSKNFLKTISALNRDFVYIGENIFSIE